MKKNVLFFMISYSMLFFAQEQEKLVRYDQGEILFLKAENYLSVFDESIYVNDNLEDLDTLNNRDKIKYEIYSEIRENIYDDVLDIYSDIIENHSKSKMFFKSLNNKAFIAKELGYIEDAIETNIQLINSKANDLEKGGLGEGLMAEPYANYKNRACRNLVNLYIERNEFKKAKKYFNLTKKYSYQHFCGNAHATDEVYMVSLESKIYEGMKEDKKALKVLFPYVFGNPFTRTDYIEDLALNLIDKLDVKSKLKGQILEQSNNIIKKEVGKGDEKRDEFYISLLDEEINVSYIGEFSLQLEDQKENIRKALLESSFYKSLLLK